MLWHIIVWVSFAVTVIGHDQTTKQNQTLDIDKVIVYGSSKALTIAADLLQGNVKTGHFKNVSEQYHDNSSTTVQQLIDEYLETIDDDNVMDRLFAEFKQMYHKVYPSLAFEQYSREQLQKRIKMVLANNIKAVVGQSSYVLKLYAGSDKAFEAIMRQPAGNWPGVGEFYDSIVNVSSYAHSFIFDPYRVANQVGKVVNQGGCGACVYFAAAATIESFWTRSGHPLVTLSTQQLNDCAHAPERGNNGCEQGGGTFVPTFDYIKEHGLTSWDNYPYIEKNAECNRLKENQTVARIQAWHPVEPHGNEEAMRHALEQHGPLAVALHFNDELAHIHSGIFMGDCEGGRNHAVLLVGYGFDAGINADYWILKNQWGASFGEGGYFRLKRNENNICDVAGDAVWVE